MNRTRSALPVSGFGPGTPISTTDGDLPVEWLCPGDRVITRDCGALRLRAVLHRRLSAADLAQSPGLRPVQLFFGGVDAARYPLTLAPATRLFVRGGDLRLVFGTACAFAPAAAWADGPAPYDAGEGYSYFHLALEGHHVIRAGGIWAESHLSGRRGSRAALPCLAGWQAMALRDLRRRPLPLQPGRAA